MNKNMIAVCVVAIGLANNPVFGDVKAGLSAINEGDYEKAIAEFASDIKAGPNIFEANLYTGQSYVSVGNAKAALPFLERAVELSPDNANAQYWWGAANGEMAGQASVFSAPGYAKKSKKALERAIELDPSHIDARAGLVEYLIAAPGFLGGDKERALVEAEAIRTLDKARGLSETANVYIAMENIDGAIGTLDQAVAEFPSHMEARLGRGMLLRELERYEPALADFEALVAVDPETTDDVGEATVLRGLGQYFFGAVSSKAGLRQSDGINMLEAYLKDGVYDLPLREGFAQYYLANLYLAEGNVVRAKELATAARKYEKNKDLKKLLKKLRKKLKKA